MFWYNKWWVDLFLWENSNDPLRPTENQAFKNIKSQAEQGYYLRLKNG